tara:strand:+ start:60 stop:1064 length:1005 start_codon:yes stop_codon:yes gene_type:complete
MEKVFVSGGSGYIALHCIKQLLEQGYLVKTSLRSLTKADNLLRNLSKHVDCKGRLEFCELNLLNDKGWDECIKGCDYVLHVASPVIPGRVNLDELVNPALGGLKRCLRAAVKNKVKRFVMTSSFAAIYGNEKNEYTDDDWTDLSNEKLFPYEISKTKAEMFLWEYIQNLSDSEKIEVCSINPVVVIGPSLSESISISNKITIKKMINGSILFNPKLSISLVDVKDVAWAHIQAMKKKNAAGNRFLLSEKTMWFSEISNILYNNGFKKVPRYTAPNWLVKFLSFFISSLKIVVERLEEKEILHTNNARIILGWNPDSIDKAIIESAKQIHNLNSL